MFVSTKRLLRCIGRRVRDTYYNIMDMLPVPLSRVEMCWEGAPLKHLKTIAETCQVEILVRFQTPSDAMAKKLGELSKSVINEYGLVKAWSWDFKASKHVGKKNPCPGGSLIATLTFSPFGGELDKDMMVQALRNAMFKKDFRRCSITVIPQQIEALA